MNLLHSEKIADMEDEIAELEEKGEYLKAKEKRKQLDRALDSGSFRTGKRTSAPPTSKPAVSAQKKPPQVQYFTTQNDLKQKPPPTMTKPVQKPKAPAKLTGLAMDDIL